MDAKNWFTEKGDETLALDWPLNDNSHVWEIGGYEGRWAQQIWDKFHCNITIFEPQLWAVDRLMKRFGGISEIDIRPYGLWINDEVRVIENFGTDGATIANGTNGLNPPGLGAFKHFYHEFQHFDQIDVCLMNIEGAEYELIPSFISFGVMQKIDHFWCQFHLKDDPDSNKSSDIFKAMEKTHYVLWNCFPTAVAWRKR